MGTKHTLTAKYDWLERVFNAALAKGKTQDKEKLTSQFCIDFKCARRTCTELLAVFRNAGKIEMVGKEIIVRKK